MTSIPEINHKYRPRFTDSLFYGRLTDKDKGVFATKAQLFTASFMLGVLNNLREELPSSEANQSFDFTNFDKTDLDLLYTVAVLKLENESEEELTKCIEEYAYGGLSILKRNFENNDGMLSLRDLFD